MKRIKTLYIILKTEYGDGEENVFTEILNASSSRSTALLMLKRYMEQYDDAIHHHEKGQRWTSIQLQQFGITLSLRTGPAVGLTVAGDGGFRYWCALFVKNLDGDEGK